MSKFAKTAAIAAYVALSMSGVQAIEEIKRKYIIELAFSNLC